MDYSEQSALRLQGGISRRMRRLVRAAANRFPSTCNQRLAELLAAQCADAGCRYEGGLSHQDERNCPHRHARDYCQSLIQAAAFASNFSLWHRSVVKTTAP